MLLDADDARPRARARARSSARAGGDARFKLELPAAQLEIVTRAARATVARRRSPALARRAARPRRGGRRHRRCSPARACTRSRAGEGELNRGRALRRASRASTAPVARRQLVCGAARPRRRPGADGRWPSTTRCARTCPSSRRWPPNAPFHEGRDTGLASVRPMICGAAAAPGRAARARVAGRRSPTRCAGARGRRVPDAAQWWWELRLHPRTGRSRCACPTRRRRSPTPARVAAVVPRARRPGSPRGSTPARRCRRRRRWRIAENRWSACAHGVDGALADLGPATREPDARAAAGAARRARAGRRRLGCAAQLAPRATLRRRRRGAARRRGGGGGRAAACAAWPERLADGASPGRRAPGVACAPAAPRVTDLRAR